MQQVQVQLGQVEQQDHKVQQDHREAQLVQLVQVAQQVIGVQQDSTVQPVQPVLKATTVQLG